MGLAEGRDKARGMSPSQCLREGNMGLDDVAEKITTPKNKACKTSCHLPNLSRISAKQSRVKSARKDRQDGEKEPTLH